PRHLLSRSSSFFFYNHPPTPGIYTLSLHDALPISLRWPKQWAKTCRSSALEHGPRPLVQKSFTPSSLRSCRKCRGAQVWSARLRSEEHTSELQSRFDLVCRLLLEKKNDSGNAYADV